MTLQPFGSPLDLVLRAATPVAGFALQNATPSIISWTAPNDGLLHRFNIFAGCHVTSTETGGLVQVTYTLPDGTAASHSLFVANSAAGELQPASEFQRFTEAGTAVSVIQASALTAGAALVWAEIWAS